LKKNDASSIQLKMRTQADVDVEMALERNLVNAEHVHVQVCRFKSLKGLLPQPLYTREHRKGLFKTLQQKMGRFKVGPFPKKQHASTCTFESFVLDMPQEKEDLDVNEFKGSN
jgi:hypothetical protein